MQLLPQFLAIVKKIQAKTKKAEKSSHIFSGCTDFPRSLMITTWGNGFFLILFTITALNIRQSQYKVNS